MQHSVTYKQECDALVDFIFKDKHWFTFCYFSVEIYLMVIVTLSKKQANSGELALILEVIDDDTTGKIEFLSGNPSSLVFDDIRLISDDDKGDVMKYQTTSLSTDLLACLGIIRIQQEDFLIMVADALSVGTLDTREIFQIRRVEAYSLSRMLNTTMPVESEPQLDIEHVVDQPNKTFSHPIVALVSLLNRGSFYYSPTKDLTAPFQSSQSPSSGPYNSPQFVWNYYLLEPIQKFLGLQDDISRLSIIRSGLFPIVINGFAGMSLCSTDAQVWVISRTSRLRTGTRYCFRGLDDDGNVANYVETETIVVSEKLLFAYITVRGSVPVFWEQQASQIAYNKIQLTRSPIATQPSFNRHLKYLQERFGLVHSLDLLSESRDQSEQLLSNAFEYHTRNFDEEIDRPIAEITHFDLNRDLTNSSTSFSEKLEDLFKLVSYEVPVFSYFVKDLSNNKILRTQRGIFRVNCFDCLDRTNMAQAFLSSKVFDLFTRNYLTSSTAKYTKESLSCLNEIWADNGDQLSIIYTGSGALKSSITRTGSYNIKGYMLDAKKSIRRVYQNHFYDDSKNESIRLLLGNAPINEKVILHDIFDIAENSVQPSNSRYTDLHVLCLTWNVNGMSPDVKDLLPLFQTQNQPDLIAVAFQEIVGLNPSQILSVDPQRRLQWEKEVLSSLREVFPLHSYSLLVSQQLVGTTLSVFARDELVYEIRNVEIAKRMTGLGGMAGNKGSVAIWFDFYQRTFCMIGSHFAAGQNNIGDRNNDWRAVFDDLVSNSGRTIGSRDVVIWMGDLNYRLDCTREIVIYHIQEGQYSELREFDQLHMQMKSGLVFSGFSEAPISFPPTYKYDVGSNVYDSSEKARVPSWTDRVLIKSEITEILSYQRYELDISDHKPVGMLCRVSI